MLNTELKNKIIKSLSTFNPEKIILFGSYAHGMPNKSSDIDLLVIKNLKEKEVRTYRLQIKKKLFEQFKDSFLYFDIIVDSEQRINNRIKIGDLFYEEIYNKGTIIYA